MTHRQASEQDGAQQTPFADLDSFVALPRLAGLALSPDGQRLVVGVGTLEPEKKQKYVTSLWEVDVEGVQPARRLTRGVKGETSAAFTPTGDLLFSAARPDGDPDDDEAPPALWLLPRSAGEARVVASRPGGLGGVVVARDVGTVVLGSATLPSSVDEESERKARSARKDAGVNAVLHTGYPVRFWDHDLGPDRQRLFAGQLRDLKGADPGAEERRLELRDLTGDVGVALDDESSWDVSADGSTAVASWVVPEEMGSQRYTLVAIDVATGRRRALADEEAYEYEAPRLSLDGTRVAAIRWLRSTPEQAPDVELVVVPLDGGPERVLGEGWDRWPTAVRWAPDGRRLVVTADSDGRAPLFVADVESGEVNPLTSGDWAYSDPAVSPDGRSVFALRSSPAVPAHPVRVDLATGDVRVLRSPVGDVPLPGRLTEVTATADDGTLLRAWLALPDGASPEGPAPLLLWIHGGPLSSWNAWSWRWNPWVMAARGYAVLLPDPALSTGHGRGFVARGWGAWGAAPFTDLMALTDAALRLDAVDRSRTAAMGGSFGGYMANWVAGHTDRFDAVVPHASVWCLDQFVGTTDTGFYWRREMSPEARERNSPHRHVDDISTPMLVIHGDKDYRVPIGEGLRLWYDLTARSKEPDGATPHRFLYFPDENHWILAPGHAKVWYSTVLAFLTQHVLGKEWRQPDLLG
ncbi:MAG: prolyl oligopeptidase family serine peptidase [Actinomycetes bacterium]